METQISDALIMRVREFGESDLMVFFFTPDQGRLKGIAKGGRKSRKRFSNCLDLFCHAKMEYQKKPRGEFHLLNSGKLIHGYQGLRSDFTSLSLASYMVEITELLFPQNVVEIEMFDLLQQCFSALENFVRPDILRIIFEIRAMALGGYRIDLDVCSECKRVYTGAGRAVFVANKGRIACLNCRKESRQFPGMGNDSVRFLTHMQSYPWDGQNYMSLNDQTILELKQVLRMHLDFRLGKRMKSDKYLV